MDADWPLLSEAAVHEGLLDPFISPLTAEQDHFGHLVDRVDPDGKFMAHLRSRADLYVKDPRLVVVALRMWVQTGRTPDDL